MRPISHANREFYLDKKRARQNGPFRITKATFTEVSKPNPPGGCVPFW